MQSEYPYSRCLRRSTLLILALSATVTSCVALKTNRIHPGTDTSQMPGVAYALPKGKITIKVEETPGTPGSAAVGTTPAIPGTEPTYKISYVSTEYVPDTAQNYFLKYKNNVMFAEDVTVKLTKTGLLDLVTITSEDKTVEIVKKIIEITQNILKSSIAQAAQGTQVIYQASFDPLNPPELWEINQQLQKVRGAPYSVSIIGMPGSAKGALSAQAYASPTEDDRINGIAYRPVLSYGVTLSHKSIPQHVQTVLLPQEAEVVYLPVRRSGFVKKVSKMDFDEGILVEATFNKPSEALGFVEIPLEISKAILALPGAVVGKNVASYKSEANTAPPPVVNENMIKEDPKDKAKRLQDEEVQNELQGQLNDMQNGPSSPILPAP